MLTGFSRNELQQIAPQILADPTVLAAIKKLGLPNDAIIQCDSWPYGADRDSNEDTPKFIQGLLYARAPHNHPDSNQYSYPLPFSPVWNVFEGKMERLDAIATGGISADGTDDGLKYGTASENPMAHCVANEYLPDLQEEIRKDVRPLHIIQPNGPSFTVEDQTLVKWQKWSFRVGFNYREGMTIHNVRYDGRPLFYRLSISEMTVPYGGK